MKQKTIYALLTAMIPGLSLAAEAPETPIRNATLLKEQAKNQAPGTAEIKTRVRDGMVKRGIKLNLLDSERAERMLDYATLAEKQKRDQELRETFATIDQAAREQLLEREIQKREKCVQEEVAKADKLVAASKKDAEEKLKETKVLASTIAQLRERIEAQTEEISATKDKLTATEQFSDELMIQMGEAIFKKEEELQKTTEELGKLLDKEKNLKGALYEAEGKVKALQKSIQMEEETPSSPLYSSLIDPVIPSDLDLRVIPTPSKAPNADAKEGEKKEGEKEEESDSDDDGIVPDGADL